MAKLSKIWAGIPGVIYAAFLTLVAVSPEDAQGNVAKWAKVVRIERWPDWLTDPWAVVIASLLVVAFYVWWWRQRGQPLKETLAVPSGHQTETGGDAKFAYKNSDVEQISTETEGEGKQLSAENSKVRIKDWRQKK
jgi:hypothetical protein